MQALRLFAEFIPVLKIQRTPTKNSSKNGGSSSIGCGADSLVVQKGRKLKQYVLEEKLDIIDYAKVIYLLYRSKNQSHQDFLQFSERQTCAYPVHPLLTNDSF